MYNRLKFRYVFARKPEYYIYNLILPVFLLSSLTFISAAYDPSVLDSRLNIVLAMLLTLVAYKFSVASSLSPICYLTFADAYVLAAFALALLLAVENALAYVG